MARSTISVDLAGAKELEAALDNLGKAVATRIGRKAVRDPANLLKVVLTLTAPYLPGRRDHRGRYYGHLRDNLKVVSVKAKKPGLILYRVSTGDAFWGNFLERGTVKMSAKPWMRPTVDRMTGEIVDLQISTIKTGIEFQARKAARRARSVKPNGRNR